MHVNHLYSLVLAAAQQSGGSESSGGCGGMGLGSIGMMVLMFAVFYFLLIRPQQKRQKEHLAMINNLKKGDQVITRGGVIGRISGVQDNVVTIEIQEKVRVRVLKSYIDGKHAEAKSSAEAKDVKESKEARAEMQPETKN